VYADTSFALWQDLNGKTLDLGDYLNRKYYDAKGNKLFNVVMRRVTSPADMALSVHLATLAQQYGGQENHCSPAMSKRRSSIKATCYHRQSSLQSVGRDLRAEPELHTDQDPHSGAPLFRNRAPQAHEDATYGIRICTTRSGAKKKLSKLRSGRALERMRRPWANGARGGIEYAGYQAAGDLVSDPQRMDMLLRSIGHKPGTSVLPSKPCFR